MKPFLKFTLVFCFLLLAGFTMTGQQLINLNPDKNGEPWIAGGLRPLTAADYEFLNALPPLQIQKKYLTGASIPHKRSDHDQEQSDRND